MTDIDKHFDDLGPIKVIHLHDPGAGLKAIVVVDNVARGVAIGGVRMAPDVTFDECRRLARAMTLKNAAANLPHGGGKSVIFGDPRMPAPDKEALVRAFARAVGDVRQYVPGPDMGTDECCMAWVHDETGRAVGLPEAIGGIPLDEIGATGFGIAVTVDVASRHCGLPLEGARVVVQGFGSVGQHAARFLAERGVRLVAVADSGGAIHAAAGLDVDALIAHKQKGHGVLDSGQGTPIDVDSLIGVDCEIWIPAARPDVIRADNAERLRARIVAQGANIAVTPAAEASLHARGIAVPPDFIANAGGVICAAVEYRGGSRREAFETIEARVSENVATVLEDAATNERTPREAGVALAEARVRAALAFRR